MSFNKTDIQHFSAFQIHQDVSQTVKRLEYQLIMESPEIQEESLNRMIYYRGMEDDRLFRPAQGGFNVNAPNYYIQKIRAIYYLMLVCVFEDPDKFNSLKASLTNVSDLKASNDMFSSKILVTRYGTTQGISNIKKAFDLLRLSLYGDEKMAKPRKKFFAQFIQLLSYSPKSHTNRISNTINKFPIIDQILIDTLINIIGSESVDDNLNIERSLKEKLGLSCEFQMFRQFKIEGISVKVIENGFRIVENQGFAEDLAKQIGKWLIENGKSNENIQQLLDVSRVDEFQDNIFDKMDQSYIFELDDFKQLDKSGHLEQSCKEGQLEKYLSTFCKKSTAASDTSQENNKIAVNSIYGRNQDAFKEGNDEEHPRIKIYRPKHNTPSKIEIISLEQIARSPTRMYKRVAEPPNTTKVTTAVITKQIENDSAKQNTPKLIQQEQNINEEAVSQNQQKNSGIPKKQSSNQETSNTPIDNSNSLRNFPKQTQQNSIIKISPESDIQRIRVENFEPRIIFPSNNKSRVNFVSDVRNIYERNQNMEVNNTNENSILRTNMGISTSSGINKNIGHGNGTNCQQQQQQQTPTKIIEDSSISKVRPSPLSFKNLGYVSDRKQYLPGTKVYTIQRQSGTPQTFREKSEYFAKRPEIKRASTSQGSNSATQPKYIFKTKTYTTNMDILTKNHYRKQQPTPTSRLQLGKSIKYRNFQQLGSYLSNTRKN